MGFKIPSLHMVPKKKTWRPCGDYRKLNARTRPVTHSAHKGFYAFPGKTVFFILIRAYNQISVQPEDVSKTAIITPLRFFEFRYIRKKCIANFPEIY